MNASPPPAGLMTDVLEAFLTSNMTSGGKLGVVCPILGQAVKEGTGCAVVHTGIVPEASIVCGVMDCVICNV